MLQFAGRFRGRRAAVSSAKVENRIPVLPRWKRHSGTGSATVQLEGLDNLYWLLKDRQTLLLLKLIKKPRPEHASTIEKM
jgi:hypothetical protein